VQALTVSLGDGTTTALVYRAENQAVDRLLILAHGAGAGQRSPFMVQYGEGLSARGLTTVTFNFLYTERQRRIPDRAPVLEACYRDVIAAVRASVAAPEARLFIGGKSMGGRIATQIAAADPGLPIAGLVLLGYPLHPPGRPDKRRDAHLPDIMRPMLVVQGSRDTFGSPAELAPVFERMSPRPRLHAIAGGDHSFKARGTNADTTREEILAAIVQFVREASR
jgi:predicted alpha/beta-hydrolase family hydrolase